ncbi:unnamed protein product [Acanthosepion pharaonis]|uniref:Uncharacterized protein n=1 Tax=Acanthosepion pharaonis TaxID=158019 RepID=A0A812DID8_ACAPH|nr:unnamed protein product [Sepia pharaonis]
MVTDRSILNSLIIHRLLHQNVLVPFYSPSFFNLSHFLTNKSYLRTPSLPVFLTSVNSFPYLFNTLSHPICNFWSTRRRRRNGGRLKYLFSSQLRHVVYFASFQILLYNYVSFGEAYLIDNICPTPKVGHWNSSKDGRWFSWRVEEEEVIHLQSLA